jgi:hypothetical protein
MLWNCYPSNKIAFKCRNIILCVCNGEIDSSHITAADAASILVCQQQASFRRNMNKGIIVFYGKYFSRYCAASSSLSSTPEALAIRAALTQPVSLAL